MSFACIVAHHGAQDLIPDALFLPGLETIMNDTARNAKPVSVDGLPLTSCPQNVPDAGQYGSIVCPWASWTTLLGWFGKMLLDPAPESTWHSKVVDILRLCDTILRQGVSSLSMGLVIPHV